MIDDVLLYYWEDEWGGDAGKLLPGGQTTYDALALWQEYWEGLTVAALTPDSQKEFHKWLAGAPTTAGRAPRQYKPTTTGKARHFDPGPGAIDRILSPGRAALNRAQKHEELESVPHIFMTQSVAQKRAAPPKGRPVTIAEIAKLVDAAQARHVLVFLILTLGTLARPSALLELVEPCWQPADFVLDLNPPGRVQNRKRRPTLKVAPSLAPWLDQAAGPGGRYITYQGKPIKDIGSAWDRVRTDAKLDDKVTPYSIRHGLAREMRRSKVPGDQIDLFLGHQPTGAAATTAIYAPYEPDYLSEAVAVIERVFQEVDRLCARKIIMRPQMIVGGGTVLLPIDGGMARTGIGEAKHLEVRRLILEGVSHGEIVRRAEVSSGTVTSIRKALRGHVTVLRAK